MQLVKATVTKIVGHPIKIRTNLTDVWMICVEYEDISGTHTDKLYRYSQEEADEVNVGFQFLTKFRGNEL